MAVPPVSLQGRTETLLCRKNVFPSRCPVGPIRCHEHFLSMFSLLPACEAVSTPFINEDWGEAEGLVQLTVSSTGLFPCRDRTHVLSVLPGHSTTAWSTPAKGSHPVPSSLSVPSPLLPGSCFGSNPVLVLSFWSPQTVRDRATAP